MKNNDDMIVIENNAYANGRWTKKTNSIAELYNLEITIWWEEKDLRCIDVVEKGRSKID